MPILDYWSVIIPGGCERFAPPTSPAVALTGQVRGDARFPDGSRVVTSRVLEIDVDRGTARTGRSLYRLGEPSPRFLDWTRVRGHRIADFTRGAPRA